MAELLRVTTEGLYCEAGDFFIDPWRPVARAVITHGHADHARGGCASYLASVDGLPVLRARLGADAPISTVAYGETVQLNGVHISLHPAGHILGSAQVRVEHKGDVWVASGDYKNGSDPTCLAMEPVRCRVFISESTFGLPIYRWNHDDIVRSEILDWWTECKNTGRVALLLGYSLGKAQRLLAMVGHDGLGPIVEHAAVASMTKAYREAGVALPQTRVAGEGMPEGGWGGSLVLAPPSVQGTPWIRKFGEISTAFASGWMQVRGARRRQGFDRGFVVSDHADWPGLLEVIAATGAERVLATHGQVAVLSRYLSEKGIDAGPLATRWSGETDGTESEPAP